MNRSLLFLAALLVTFTGCRTGSISVPEDTTSDVTVTYPRGDTATVDTADTEDTNVVDSDTAAPLDTDMVETDTAIPADTDTADTAAVDTDSGVDTGTMDTDTADTGSAVDTDTGSDTGSADTDTGDHGSGLVDADGDNFEADLDCNDADPAVNPGAIEICDTVDNDCNGTADDAAIEYRTAWYFDRDGDGYGLDDIHATTYSCESDPAHPIAPGYVLNKDDCNDLIAAVNPAATEACNNVDDDCDGGIDEGHNPTTWYADADRDGYRNSAVSTSSCQQPTGYLSGSAGTDCDDANRSAHSTTAPEVCDLADNDCDGQVDEGSFTVLTWHQDADLDQYGSITVTVRACAQPAGYIENGTDCDDTSNVTFPSADEICDGKDNNCNGAADERNCP